MLHEFSAAMMVKSCPVAPARRSRIPSWLLLSILALASAACIQAAGNARGTSGTKRESAVPKTGAAAPAGPASGPRLDSAKVHMLYVEGEFDQAIAILEGNLRDTRQYNHQDSVFIYKHLGVMYAAQEATREKGRYYMHRLLLVEPTAKIMDMYASDMIYMIFKNIQEEYEATHEGRLARADTAQARPDQARPGRESRASGDGPPKGGAGYVWLGAAAVAVVAGAATWYYVAEEKPKAIVQDHQPQ